VFVTEDRDSGKIVFGVGTDIGEECVAARDAYQAEREVMALDFGLFTLFAADDGALIGSDMDANHVIAPAIGRL
jgi:hypothetical protein